MKDKDTDSEDARICALCKWNKNVNNNFFCGNINQENIRLKHKTEYNSTCELFQEHDDRKRMYDFWDQEII